MRTAARVQSGLCWCGCDAGYCATIVGRRGDGGSAGMVGMALAAVGGAMHKAGTVCTFFCGDHGGGGADGIFELLAGNTAAMAGTHGGGGSTAAEARTAIFLAGSTATETRTACIFFWRGPRRRRQGRHIFLLAGSTAAEAGTASLFSTGSSAEEARTAYSLFWQGEQILFFGSGTAEVNGIDDEIYERADFRSASLVATATTTVNFRRDLL